MKEKEMMLPRATAELAEEYSELLEKYADYDYSLTDDERNGIEKEGSQDLLLQSHLGR